VIPITSAHARVDAINDTGSIHFTIQALNGALTILSQGDSREAFTLAVIAPTGIVAIILTSPNTAIISRILGDAETL